MINNVGNSQAVITGFLHNEKQLRPNQLAQTCLGFVSSGNIDTVEIGCKTETTVYSKSDAKNYGVEIAQELKKDLNERMRCMVEKLIRNQGKYSNCSIIDVNDVNQANRAISEEGEFGVKAVSDRIVNFAIAISGNDKTKLDTLKSAIEEGFEEAKKAFGGTLPDICSQTHDEIMKKLDKWADTE